MTQHPPRDPPGGSGAQRDAELLRHLNEGRRFLHEHLPDFAETAFRAALDLDPGNRDAQDGLRAVAAVRAADEAAEDLYAEDGPGGDFVEGAATVVDPRLFGGDPLPMPGMPSAAPPRSPPAPTSSPQRPPLQPAAPHGPPHGPPYAPYPPLAAPPRGRSTPALVALGVALVLLGVLIGYLLFGRSPAEAPADAEADPAAAAADGP